MNVYADIFCIRAIYSDPDVVVVVVSAVGVGHLERQGVVGV
jgi:hypothetical protein